MSERYFAEMPDGAKYGPADLSLLKQWVAERRIGPETTLVGETSGTRLRADAVPGLFGGETASPPPITTGVPPTHTAPYDAAPPKKSRVGLIIGGVLLGSLCICAIPVAAIVFPVFAQAKQAATRTKGLSNIKQLTTGILIYTADTDDVFPPKMASAADVRLYLAKISVSPEAFLSANPKGGEIVGDGRLGGKSMTALVAPQDTVMFYDNGPWPDGRTPVGYADGHAKMTSQTILPSMLMKNPFGDPE